MRKGRPRRANGLPTTVAILLVATLSSPVVAGGATSGAVVVGATVRPRTVADSVSRPPALVVTKEDAARGYVDVIDGGGWSVRNNTRAYLVTVEIGGPLPVVAAELDGLGSTRSLGSRGGEVLRKTVGPGRDTVGLAWRFHLAEGVAAGTYDWPVRLTFAPR